MPAIILDRDGVINEDSPAFIKSVQEWVPIPGSLDAIARLSRAGWTVAVCTNQSGIARGLLTEETLDAIHGTLKAEIAVRGGRVNGIYYCPHGPEDGCYCRKPAPGLLLEAASDLGFPLPETVVVGDSGRDLEAARAVGARPILVRTGKGRTTELAGQGGDAPVFDTLADAVCALLASSGDPHGK